MDLLGDCWGVIIGYCNGPKHPSRSKNLLVFSPTKEAADVSEMEMAICIEKSFTHSCYFDWARVGADCERCYTFNYKMRAIPLYADACQMFHDKVNAFL